jgi:Uma2 family endonuclease
VLRIAAPLGVAIACYSRRMSQPAPAEKRATYADLARVPDHLIGEILDGELLATPRPAGPHARTAFRLSAALGGPFDEGRDGPGGWLFLFEPELHLHDDVVVPDLAAWRRTRLPSVPDAPFLTLAPDWVCEILSPSTERADRLHKLGIYGREGVAHAWLINPVLRTLEVLRLEEGRWMVAGAHGKEAVESIEPFDAISLDLARIWPA